MAGLTPTHLLIILVVALIVIGPGKLPEVGAALGKSLREFQKASGGLTGALTGTLTQPAQPAQPAETAAPAPAPQPVQPAPPAQSYYAAPNGFPAMAPAPVQYPVMSPIEPAPAPEQPEQTVPMSAPQPDGAVGPQSPTPKVD
jgi:TatA/E family protein of Tat protein translocase